MADLATAYLRLIPSLKGAGKEIKKELDAEVGTDMGKQGTKSGEDFGGGFKGGIGKLALGNFLGNALTQGASMAVDGLVNVFKDAFSATADYQQLTGGIETLFGDTAEQAMENAAKAYQTAGMSANEYMETVTGFSASLRQSLGEENAWQLANYADEAVQDMADNANKMGTDMARIQDAYQGFAKQNYTMLDNLKLGYGGTKTEMQRLLRDAEQLAGYTEGAFNEENFADVVEAIHIVQENMGITGTTAAEASQTISGSIATAQAAYQNLLVALGTGNGVQEAMDNLFTSLETVMANVAPMIETMLPAIGQAIGQAVAYILSHIPDILMAAGELILGLVQGLAEGLMPAMAAMEEVVNGALDAAGQFVDQMITAGADLINGFIQGIQETIGGVADAITSGIGGAVDGLLGFLGIASPSKLFTYIGEMSMQGLIVGTDNMTDDVNAAMQGAINDVYGTAKLQSDIAVSAAGNAGAVSTEMGGMGVYIDGRKLVGYIAPDVNTALGRMY